MTEGFGTSSIERPTHFRIKRSASVPVFRLDSILDLLDFESIDRIDYLKTDCQGHDLKVLIGASKWLDSIAIVTSETWAPGYEIRKSDYEGAVRKFLKSKGF